MFRSTNVFNVFSDALKIVKASPIFKSGGSNETKNTYKF